MDRHALALFIPIVAMTFGGLIALSFTSLGRALAKRLSGETGSPELEARVGELERALDETRRELAETQERLDFAERALARGREAPRLADGRS